MPANFNRFFVESPGNTILAAHYNGEFDNILTNFTPAGLDDASANVSAMQATVDPGEPGSESLATSTEGEIQRLRFVLKEVKGTPQWYGSPAFNLSNIPLVPIGGIVAHYDFNGLVTIPFGYLYCDGSVISDVDSVLDGQTLPDLSNRGLVGFGTEAGGDIDSAAWETTPVGNANHQINIAHTHDTNIGSFTSGGASTTTTSSNGSHDHDGVTDGMSTTATENSADYRIRDDGSGWVNRIAGSRHIAVDTGSNNEGQHDHEISSDGAHTHTLSHTHAIDPPNTTSTSSLSTTQSVQDRAVRVRWMMRIK